MNQQQFNDLVYPEPNTGCFLWAGRCDSKGYGRLSSRSNHQVAHRQSFEYANGKFDYKFHVLHTCDNPMCVNPDHLYLGDQKQNNIDRDTRGRQKTKRGTEHKLAKITEQDAINIRVRYFVIKDISQRHLAKCYGISQRKILDILKGRSWKHVLPQ